MRSKTKNRKLDYNVIPVAPYVFTKCSWAGKNIIVHWHLHVQSYNMNKLSWEKHAVAFDCCGANILLCHVHGMFAKISI